MSKIIFDKGEIKIIKRLISFCIIIVIIIIGLLAIMGNEILSEKGDKYIYDGQRIDSIRARK